VLLATDQRTAGKSTRSQVVERFGVPTSDHFEHLAATMAEATPLYELCATVIEQSAFFIRG
jgi:adenylate kinase family enzyme